MKKNRRTFLAQGAAIAAGASSGMAQAAAQGLAGQPWERAYGTPFEGCP